MLDSLRKHATGWVAKLLFAILILSFAIWGIGDVVRSSTSGAGLAQVAGTEVTTREVTNEFDRQWRQLQEQFGDKLDRRTAVSLGLLNQALQTAIARHLVDAHARDLGLTMADVTIAERIRQNPTFTGANGFDRDRLNLYLRSVGMSEQDFVAAMRNDLVRNSLIEALGASLAVPKTTAAKLLEHRQEQRRGEALLVKADAMPVEDPGDDVLNGYLEAHKSSYETPERRSLSLLVLRPEDLAGEIQIGDDELRATYDSRIASYKRPEQRKVEQILASDEATIRQAAQLVAAGQSLAAVAQTLKNAGMQHSELGPLAKGDLPTGLDDAAWALPQGGVSEPLHSDFGWHILKITQIEPEQSQPFASVKDELQRELALERAASQLPDLATRLDDDLAAGAGMDEAAAKLGLEVAKLGGIDRTGHTVDKERLAADRLTPDILSAAFTGAQGETSLLEQTQDGRYYMFRVDAIEPAHARTLAEVRPELLTAWTKEEQQKRAHARAEELRGQASSPAALTELARSEPAAQLIAVGPLTREDDAAALGLDAQAVAALFATPAGQVATGVTDVPRGAAIVATEEILPAKIEPALLDGTEAAVLANAKNELIADYEAALRRRYAVDIDQSALARLMEQQSQ